MSGIKASELRQYVIRPTLKAINLWSEAAENLLLGTAAQESQLGHYLTQVKGPALGIYQIEPNTHKDVWKNYLKYQHVLSDAAYRMNKGHIFSFNLDSFITRLVVTLQV